MIHSEKLAGLTLRGYEEGAEFDETLFDVTRIDELRSVVRQWFRKTSGINLHVSSYSLKHAMERYLGRERLWDGVIDGYVSNGEMIYAMVLEGFTVARNEVDVWFNISKIDFDAFNIVASLDAYQWHIAHTHVTLARIEEVSPELKGEYSAYRYHITRKDGFSRYRQSLVTIIE